MGERTFTEYTCDKCGAVEMIHDIALGEDGGDAGWRVVNVTNPNSWMAEKIVLCPACAAGIEGRIRGGE